MKQILLVLDEDFWLTVAVTAPIVLLCNII
jgi:hypothetical protein